MKTFKKHSTTIALIPLAILMMGAVTIQSGATSDKLTIDATSKAARVSLYDPSGTALHATRTPITISKLNFTPTTSDALIALDRGASYAAGVACTSSSCTITGGKRLRLVSWCVSTRNAGAAVQGLQVRIRVQASAACTTSSPVVAILGAGTGVATANVVGAACASLDQGTGALELSGSNQLCISTIGTNTAGADIALIGYEY